MQIFTFFYDSAPLARSQRIQAGTKAKVPCRHLGTCLAALVLLSGVISPVASADAPNPVRRVINMLEMMQKKVGEEGQNQEVLFDKYMCFCQTSQRKLTADIRSGKEMIPQLESTVKEAAAEKAGLENRIGEAKAEHADATKTLEEAKSIRDKENKDFIEESNQKKVDIESLNKAVAKLSEGETGLLQMGKRLTSTISRLVSTSADVSTSDREVVESFLSVAESEDDGDDSSPAEITGILKQMADSMTEERSQLKKDENLAVMQFEALKTAKEAQISTLNIEIKSKTERVGQVDMELVQDEQKLEETRQSLEANEKLEATLSKECKARNEEYNTEVKSRSEELTAISDTIQLLNDDAAFHLFKKSFPSGAASFLQIQASPKHLKGDALQTLQSALPKGNKDPRMDFVALALRSKKTSFTEVLKMIDTMVALLHKEEKNDVDKKQYCETEIAKTNDEKKELNQLGADLKNAMDQTAQKLKSANADIRAKEESIETLDNQVADATKQRKEEHQDYMENLASNNAAKEILGVAKDRLGKFYKAEALLQTTNATYTAPKKREDGKAVVTLINTIIADVDKDIKEMTSSEEDAQFQYEQAMKDSAEKRAGDARAVSELAGVKADAETDLLKMSKSVKAKAQEAEGKDVYLADLHKQCDFLLKNFETLKAARASEIDALHKTKAILTSADANFLQVAKRTWRGLRPARRHT